MIWSLANDCSQNDAIAEVVWMLLDCDHDGELTREELNQFASMATNFQLLPSEKCAAPGSACADS